MDKLLITGGKRLVGDIRISGAKNAALPILCAGLLTAGDLQLSNVPNLHDVSTMLKLLRQTGLSVEQNGDQVTLNGAKIDKLEAPYELVKTMRARRRCRSAPPNIPASRPTCRRSSWPSTRSPAATAA
jgi:UDP-N-acetylglucosamine 1-carboxyvinyltransferase